MQPEILGIVGFIPFIGILLVGIAVISSFLLWQHYRKQRSATEASRNNELDDLADFYGMMCTAMPEYMIIPNVGLGQALARSASAASGTGSISASSKTADYGIYSLSEHRFAGIVWIERTKWESDENRTTIDRMVEQSGCRVLRLPDPKVTGISMAMERLQQFAEELRNESKEAIEGAR